MNLTQKVLAKLGIEVAGLVGDRAWAICPFHDDKQPTNFFVRWKGEKAGLYHCFACKAHGDLLDLIVASRDCSKDGAREWLARLREGGDVEEAGAPVVDEVRLVVSSVGQKAFRLPQEVKFGRLADWVTPARKYAEERHLTFEQVANWGLGYATVGRLAGRIVIPVRDAHGCPWSYMARTFAGHDARYYYPAEREGADLDCIFGEEWWPVREERKELVCIVAEGALNALAVERALGESEHSVAALGGSDVRPVHVGKLATFGTVVVMTDDDQAGEGAAFELSCQLARHTRVVRVSLGEGRDADSIDPAELRDACTASI